MTTRQNHQPATLTTLATAAILALTTSCVISTTVDEIEYPSSAGQHWTVQHKTEPDHPSHHHIKAPTRPTIPQPNLHHQPGNNHPCTRIHPMDSRQTARRKHIFIHKNPRKTLHLPCRWENNAALPRSNVYCTIRIHQPRQKHKHNNGNVRQLPNLLWKQWCNDQSTTGNRIWCKHSRLGINWGGSRKEPPHQICAQNRTRTCMHRCTRTWNERVYHFTTWARFQFRQQM